MGIVNVKGLKKTFGDLTAVDGISVTIEPGEIHGILGPNGAGKSTTIGCITGLLPYDSGSVTYEDAQSIGKWKRNIGYIPQDLAIYPDLSAEENVRFFCSLYGFKGSELKKKTEEALDFVGLLEVKRSEMIILHLMQLRLMLLMISLFIQMDMHIKLQLLKVPEMLGILIIGQKLLLFSTILMKKLMMV